jgi:hypothetical protein
MTEASIELTSIDSPTAAAASTGALLELAVMARNRVFTWAVRQQEGEGVQNKQIVLNYKSL